MGTILIGNIKGPQGSQGIQGPQGPVGPVGPTGPGADIYNGLDQTEAGVAGLDSYQGRVLDQKKLDAANVANNLTTAGEGYALDARMGKTLQDQITSLNNSLQDQITSVNNSLQDQITSVNNSLANKSVLFGPKTSYQFVSPDQYNSLEAAISGILPSGDGAAAYIRSFKYNAQITSPVSANQAWVFGWLNSSGTYGWCFLMTYTGCFYGTRNNSTQTVWHALY